MNQTKPCRVRTVHAFPAKVQYNDRRTQATLEGKPPYWKSQIWNVSVGIADFFAT